MTKQSSACTLHQSLCLPLQEMDRHASLAMTRDVVRRLLPAPKFILSRAALIAALPLLLSANVARADVANDPVNLSALVGAGTTLTSVSVFGFNSTGNILIGLGRNASSQYRPCYWTEEAGVTDLGSFGGTFSYAVSISNDGRVIVGESSLTGNAVWRAFRWTAETGMVDLGSLLGGGSSSATAVSADGAVVVGVTDKTGGYQAFRWTEETGMVALGALGGTISHAYDTSSDGGVIVGIARTTGNAAWHPFRWSQETGMVDLGTLGGTNAYGNKVSGEGAVIVGHSQIAGNTATHAFRWTQATGMQDLGTLGGTNSYGRAVSSDGTLIGGQSQTTGNASNHAFLWTEATGMQDLNTLMSAVGVDMSNIVLSQVNKFTADNKKMVGSGSFNGTSASFLACYDPGENGCVGLTTASKQEEAAIDLASNQQIAMAESRSAANELMGFTRPMTMSTQTFSGAMFGSAMGYAGGQYTKDRFTLLGGLGYGAQDYKYIKPENSLTVASGLRYTFNSVVGDQSAVGALSPFVEAGGWYTPDMEVALSRPYNNGTGTNRGEGNTNSSSWAEYVKAGLVWDQSEVNQFTAYGEIGRQHMLFDGYSETATSTNPFPATISDSEMTFNFARAGGSWTRQLDKFMGKPVSFTVAGAVAHSFGVKTNLTSTVSGVGTAHAVAKKNLWAEYGGRLSSDLTDNVALNLDVTGTTGNNGMGTAIHGGAGVSLKF